MSQRAELMGKTRRALSVGPSGIAQRALRRTGAENPAFYLDLVDLLVDVPVELPVPTRRPELGSSLCIGWMKTPPMPGSGGRTTLSRTVGALEAAGHRCVLFLCGKHGLDAARTANVIGEKWPGVSVEVRDERANWRAQQSASEYDLEFATAAKHYPNIGRLRPRSGS